MKAKQDFEARFLAIRVRAGNKRREPSPAPPVNTVNEDGNSSNCDPKLVIALGATAARGVLGKTVTIGATRGPPQPFTGDMPVMVTIHPSSLLRIPEAVQRRAEYFRFVKELQVAAKWLRKKSG